jgi:DNA-binding MarR family transcriptional regulator
MTTSGIPTTTATTAPNLTPILNPQVVGRAENAHRPVLERILSGTGTTRHQWVALTLTATAEGAVDRDQLAARIADALKIDDATALAAIGGLATAGLLEELPGQASRIGLTGAGRERHRQIRSAVDRVVSRAYGDIPAEDLATAGRVLTLITARLNAGTADAPGNEAPIAR